MLQPFFCIQEWRETPQRTLGKRRFFVLLFLEVEYINHILYVYRFIYYIFIYYLYIVFSLCSFSLMFYGINFLCPASGSFLYLVSKGRSAGCARNDNSVSFHHAMFAHQCRNSEKYGINFFPDYKTKTESFTSRSLLIEISLFNIHHL